MGKAREYVESAEVERPPAFQVYAAAMLGTEAFRLMSLAEQGLLWSLKLYVWINDSVPADPGQMARAIGRQEGEVRAAFTPAVEGFFQLADDDPTRLVCPALVRQMRKLLKKREAQARGGRIAARSRREKKYQAIANRPANPVAIPVGLEMNRTEQKRTEQSVYREDDNGSTDEWDNGDPEFLSRVAT